jgi:hypothetical protein
MKHLRLGPMEIATQHVQARGLKTNGRRSPPQVQPTTGQFPIAEQRSCPPQPNPSLAPKIAPFRAPPVEEEMSCSTIRAAPSLPSALGCCVPPQLAAAPTSACLDAVGGREDELVAAGTESREGTEPRDNSDHGMGAALLVTALLSRRGGDPSCWPEPCSAEACSG